MRNTGSKNTGQMITNISEFEVMNRLILEIVRLLIKDKPRNILVLGARREQLEWLNETFQELGIKNSKHQYATSGLYYGNLGMNKKLYWNMMEKSANCDVIWGTNDIAKEGLDIPSLNTLILLNGGYDVEQAVGRILRKCHTDAPPAVIDLVYKCGNFPKHANARRKYYDYEGYLMQKHCVTIGDDPTFIEVMTPKLEEFLERYPEEGDQDLVTVRRRTTKPALTYLEKKKSNDPNPFMEKAEYDQRPTTGGGCLFAEDDNNSHQTSEPSKVIPLGKITKKATSVAKPLYQSKPKETPVITFKSKSSSPMLQEVKKVGNRMVIPLAPLPKRR